RSRFLRRSKAGLSSAGDLDRISPLRSVNRPGNRGMDPPMQSDKATENPASDHSTDRGFEAWFLGGPLSAILLIICGVQLATWLPHYLTWPYWADHDVFATIARAWDRGFLP